MRSHIINSSVEADEKMAAIRNFSSLNNGGSNTYVGCETGSEAGIHTSYGLRENPKKTWRVSDSSEDTLLLDKFCKECGKGFHSWKALFGHMKCHSDKERASNSLEDQDSWTNGSQKLVVDSQTDNETAAPNRRRGSKRRTRYMTTATSSFSIAKPSSSVCEVEPEQEQVAMCLMMLSRDASPWGGMNSAAESSDNTSMYLEAPSLTRTNLIMKIEGNTSSSNFHSEFPRNVYRMNKTKVFTDGILKNDKVKKSQSQSQLDDQSASEDSEDELGKNVTNETGFDQLKSATNKHTSIKRKFCESYTKLNSNSLKKSVNKPIEAEFCRSSIKRSKFECTTCNKIFHSYQALGGHRASHKKMKGCFASRIERSENSIETEHSRDATTDSKLFKSTNDDYLIDHDMDSGIDHKSEISTGFKRSKGHECPICLKVFPSGQALGGHKRSHLVNNSKSTNCQTIVIQKPVPEIRDFLDLNLPAPGDDESNSHVQAYKPWWVGSIHKHEALVDLMSN
ncbi:Zinc finger protein [Quillaja saponaria]|uniref:Zinc finger protein n=1 Tax=Quillaja saponaria TaxID=32244 RepID=A0AAD7PIY7_QUISA|nr:Zinc finger protein [Quillaja saponaria]